MRPFERRNPSRWEPATPLSSEHRHLSVVAPPGTRKVLGSGIASVVFSKPLVLCLSAVPARCSTVDLSAAGVRTNVCTPVS